MKLRLFLLIVFAHSIGGVKERGAINFMADKVVQALNAAQRELPPIVDLPDLPEKRAENVKLKANRGAFSTPRVIVRESEAELVLQEFQRRTNILLTFSFKFPMMMIHYKFRLVKLYFWAVIGWPQDKGDVDIEYPHAFKLTLSFRSKDKGWSKCQVLTPTLETDWNRTDLTPCKKTVPMIEMPGMEGCSLIHGVWEEYLIDMFENSVKSLLTMPPLQNISTCTVLKFLSRSQYEITTQPSPESTTALTV